MDIDVAELQKLLDKEAIREAGLRYTRGIDRHDYELMAQAYHPGAVDDHGVYIGDGYGFVDYQAGKGKTKWDAQQHYILNQTIDLDGDTAHAETYYIAAMRRTEGPPDIAGGRYVDRYEKRDGRWAVASRICIVEWTGELNKTEETLSPTMFVSGTWDKTDVSYMRPLEVSRSHRKPD